MKNIIWIIVVLAIGGYIFNSYLENKAKSKAKRIAAEKVEQAVKSAVAKMVSRMDAVNDWEMLLSKGEQFRAEPVLTVELEKLWLQNRPILFIGSIKDIASYDQSRYTVLVERSLFGSFEHMFGTEFQLSLISSRERIDSFLEKHPDLFKKYGFNNGVAVIAKINAIRTTYMPGEEGGRQEVKIGAGEMLDILYTGDVIF